MKVISTRRCTIGEGPVWNPFDNKLYHVNGLENEIYIIDLQSGELTVRKLSFNVAAIAFTKEEEIIITCSDGAFYLNKDDSRFPMYDSTRHQILYCNDAKVGPDGRFYVGTQSSKRVGAGDEADGKLYSIDKYGNVKVLLDGLLLSNGFDWSMNEKLLYHTDSDTGIIKEYDFDIKSGEIIFTGRQVNIPGVDGFTIDQNDNLYVACWKKGHIAIVDTFDMQIKEYMEVPATIPASCCFAGENMDQLAIVTAAYKTEIKHDRNAGFTFLCETETRGRVPYLFDWER